MLRKIAQRSRSRAICSLRTLAAVSVAALLCSSLAHAADDHAHAADDDLKPSMLSFSAFGTLGIVHSSEDRADFTSNLFKPDGAGYTHAWSPDVDSKVGGQVIASFTPQLSGMVQVIAEQNYDGTFTPHIEWANLKYQLTPDASLRFGRIVLPSFLFSQSRNVAYTNPWVRPPRELYSLVPVDTSDGGDFSYALQSGRVNQTWVGTFGVTNSKKPTGGTGNARRLWSISDTIQSGSLTAHLTYQQGNLTLSNLHTLFGGFRRFGAQGDEIADAYDPYNRRLTFFGAGAVYDPGNWFLIGEWGTTDFHSVLGKSTAWYASSGYRLAKLTPYLTYGQLRGTSNRSDPGLNVASLPPGLAGPATGLNAALNSILGSIADQKTVSIGTRWDVFKDVDLKVQYDRTRLGAGSPGTLINLQPGFQSGGTVNLFSVAVDFVW